MDTTFVETDNPENVATMMILAMLINNNKAKREAIAESAAKFCICHFDDETRDAAVERCKSRAAQIYKGGPRELHAAFERGDFGAQCATTEAEADAIKAEGTQIAPGVYASVARKPFDVN
jgi:hypothetical protein